MICEPLEPIVNHNRLGRGLCIPRKILGTLRVSGTQAQALHAATRGVDDGDDIAPHDDTVSRPRQTTESRRHVAPDRILLLTLVVGEPECKPTLYVRERYPACQLVGSPSLSHCMQAQVLRPLERTNGSLAQSPHDMALPDRRQGRGCFSPDGVPSPPVSSVMDRPSRRDGTRRPMSPDSSRYDAIVIGSGPGGEGAAMQLAKHGKRVAVIEEYQDVGGGCTHWGTIPSKTLRHAVQQLADYRNHPIFRNKLEYIDVSYREMLQAANAVISEQTSMRRNFYFRNRVDVIHGHARFVDPTCIEVLDPHGAKDRYHADNVVIATGSRPYRPPDVDFSHPLVRDSDTVLSPDMREARSITIYGAGIIGSEYASIFGTLGWKVDLVNTRDRLLSFLDDEITDALSYHLRGQGVHIRNDEEYERVEYQDDSIVLHCRSGKRFRSNILLWANGRTGNSRDLGIDEIGVRYDHRGNIEVNESLQTDLPNIYAVGDVVGPPALASASYDQGRFAAGHIVKGRSDWNLVRDIPTGIYTNPEISSLGPTERELTEECIPYEVGRAMFRSVARAQITGHPVGMVKILFHTDTLEILGIHCFGRQAAEIVHIGQAIMSQKGAGNTLMYFVNTTFNYPTMAEAYRIAALNGLNRIR